MLEHILDLAGLGVGQHQVEQPDDREMCRIGAPRAQDRRAREVVALEKIETEFAAHACLLGAVDLFGQQLHRPVPQPGDQCAQRVGSMQRQIDFHDVDQIEQWTIAFVVGEIVQGQPESPLLEQAAAFDDGFGNVDGFEQLEYHLRPGQDFDQVGQQHIRADVDETGVLAQYCLDAHFAEGMAYDAGGRLHVVRDAGLAGAPGTEQQFVGDDALVAIEYGLPPEKNFLADHRQSPRVAHSASTRIFTAGSIAIGVPHSRWVSPGHLSVASMPILLPRPDTGLAKSR